VGADAGDPSLADADEHEVLIRAPMSGAVVGLAAQPGAVVLLGAPLVDVSRTSSLMLQLHLPERALAVARAGTSIRFTVPAYGKESFEARVIRVAPTLDSLTRTFAVQAQVAAHTDRLRAEMYATAELLGPPGDATVIVPADAIQSFEGDTVVIAAHERANGLELEAVRVRVGRRTPSRVGIADGVPVGMPLVVDGAAIAKAELLRRRGAR
jgi:RND family efflux transporter MFP subunit